MGTARRGRLEADAARAERGEAQHHVKEAVLCRCAGVGLETRRSSLSWVKKIMNSQAATIIRHLLCAGLL